MKQASEKKHRLLMAEIESQAGLILNGTGHTTFSDRVLAAMNKVPRHEFVAEDDIPFAYVNRPLPIGYGQTISQPIIVAFMTELLELAPSDRVLEIGTGSGYQTAVLAEVARQVYSIETIPELAAAAARRLNRLGYENVEVRTGQGRDGWAEEAPFQAIMVTAASRDMPGALVDQLVPGGRMIIPIGSFRGFQNLVMVLKDEAGDVSETSVLAVAFVPLV